MNNADIPSLTDLFELGTFEKEGKTIIELITVLNNRHRAIVAELNQRLIDRQESHLLQTVRIEETWREKLREAQSYADKCKVGCVELSFALSKIDYLCGPPNEMEVSGYCVHQNEDAVVDEVRKTLADKDAQILALRGCLEHLRSKDWFTDLDFSLPHTDVICSLNAIKVRAALSTPPPPVVPLADVKPLLEVLKELAVHDAGTEETLAAFLAKHPAQTPLQTAAAPVK